MQYLHKNFDPYCCDNRLGRQ